MFELRLRYVKIPDWTGYQNTTKYLPQRMALLAEDAAAAFEAMNLACDELITYTDCYRSVQTQIDAIRAADKTKKRLYAPPTKSGHQFGQSLDVSVDESLKALSASSKPELRAAGASRDAMAAWMLKFGWHGISTEAWHFDFLAGHRLVTEKIQALYGKYFTLTDIQCQQALNKLLGAGLSEDGVMGAKSITAVKAAREKLAISPEQDDAWFRRVLACATATLVVIK